MRARGFVLSLGASSLLILVEAAFGASTSLAVNGPPPTPPAAQPSAVSGSCDASATAGCAAALLRMLNFERSRYRVPALAQVRVQSTGRASCPGAYGHSTAMARSGFIWHINPHYPRASFPNNICVRYTAVGENVGVASTGAVLQDLGTLDQEMMSEPHNRSICAAAVNHACNILSPSFHRVGIGIYVAQGYTWLTEDFTN